MPSSTRTLSPIAKFSSITSKLWHPDSTAVLNTSMSRCVMGQSDFSPGIRYGHIFLLSCIFSAKASVHFTKITDGSNGLS